MNKESAAFIEALKHVSAIKKIQERRDKFLNIKSEDEPFVEERRWSYREAISNRYLKTNSERNCYYLALLNAAKWGKEVSKK